MEQQQKLWLWAIGIVAIVVALCLFNPFSFYFLNDDFIHIPLSKEGALFQRNSFRPVCDLSVTFDYWLWGRNAAGYHFINLLLHIVNTFLVFSLSIALLKKYGSRQEARQKAFMVSLVFFVYAFHSETIFWILGRSASLGTLFFIPALLFYLKRHQSVGWLTGSIIFFLIGLFTYESVWMFPIVTIILAIYDRQRFSINLEREVVYNVIILSVFSGYLILRHATIGEVVGGYEAANFIKGNIGRLATNFIALVTRCFTPPVANNNVLAINAGIIALLAVIILIRSKRVPGSLRFVLLSLMFLLIAVLPYLSLGISTQSVEGERFLYLPSIFAAILLVESISMMSSMTRNVLILFALLLGYNLFFLYKPSDNYKTASTITKATFREINDLKGKRRLFIIGLPQNSGGALMFRLGLEEGIEWLKQPATVDSIIVLSLQSATTRYANNFSLEVLDVKTNRTFDKILVKGPEAVGGYIEKAVAPLTFDRRTDALFIYNERSLRVVK